MAKNASVPERQARPKRQPEPKRKPEIAHGARNEQEVLDKEDQADSGPDKDNPLTHPDTEAGLVDPQNAHIGAREDQVSNTQAPAGDAYKDEPKQG